VSIRVRPDATSELADLLARIHSGNPQASQEVQECVQLTLELLEANPLSGARLRSKKPSLRMLRYATVRYYPQFVILYLPLADGVDVLHIVRGRRSLKNVLADD
jgi:plasmid stabilization system protein ParE